MAYCEAVSAYAPAIVAKAVDDWLCEHPSDPPQAPELRAACEHRVALASGNRLPAPDIQSKRKQVGDMVERLTGNAGAPWATVRKELRRRGFEPGDTAQATLQALEQAVSR